MTELDEVAIDIKTAEGRNEILRAKVRASHVQWKAEKVLPIFLYLKAAPHH